MLWWRTQFMYGDENRLYANRKGAPKSDGLVFKKCLLKALMFRLKQNEGVLGRGWGCGFFDLNRFRLKTSVGHILTP